MAAPTITLDMEPRTVEADAGPGPDATCGDPFGLDPEFRLRVLPAARFLFERYWRVEVSGIHNVPEHGPALVVSNHSGALPFDGAMLCTAIQLHCGRTLRFLYDRFVEELSPLATFYN